jgi:AcrR family transcriptional regulator
VTGKGPFVQQTHDRIVSGTGAAITREGLVKVKVSDILVAAGVSRRTFYLYFPNKDQVVLSIYEDIARRLTNTVRAAVLGTPNPVEKIATAVDAFLEFEQGGGLILFLLQSDATRPDSLLAPIRERTLDDLVAVISDQVREHMGLVLDPLAYRALLMGIEQLVIHLQRDGVFTDTDRKRVRNIMQPTIMHLLAAGRHLPGPPDPEGSAEIG